MCAYVNEKGYVVSTRTNNVYKKNKIDTRKGSKRDWWLVKNQYGDSRGSIELSRIYFPKEYIGKRIKIKVEII